MQVQSTYAAPGKKRESGFVEPAYSTFGHQTQVMLVAPTEVKMSWTWRHIRTYCPCSLAFVFSCHGKWAPPRFISGSNRRKSGLPHAFAAAAHERRNASWPLAIMLANWTRAWSA